MFNIKFINNKFNIKNIPNGITLLRLILIIPIIIFLEFDTINFVWIVLIIGSITDYFDGYIAKKFNLVSRFGSILDPVVDKIFITIPLIWLCLNQTIPFWSLSLIIIREFIISAIRENNKDGLPALKIAKFKTTFLFISLIILFSPNTNDLIFTLGLVSYWIGYFLTLISLINYLKIK